MNRKSHFFKGFAVFTGLNILAQVLLPTAALALTGGPSQPEFESFEPIGTNQMVDLFSGDFNYNIPLMNVPGPNGGYPINLAYHAGIGMEQEASWVGLGWNINPGVINRHMRGIPDDAKGDIIEQEMNLRPDRTLSLKLGQLSKEDKEAAGFEYKLSTNLKYFAYYNNYRGIGYRADVSITGERANKTSSDDKDKSALYAGVTASFDSQNGVGINPSLSYGKKGKEVDRKFTVDANYDSKQGIRDFGFKYKATAKALNEDGDVVGKAPVSAGVTFAKAKAVPRVSFPMVSTHTGVNVQIGNINGSDFNPDKVNVEADYSETTLQTKRLQTEAYGLF